jgi:putative lipoprotein
MRFLALACLLLSHTTLAASVTGSAAYRERMALPPKATIEALIEDVSRADASAEVLGRVTSMPAGQVPIHFVIPYDPAQVDPTHRYSVRVRILDGDILLYTSTEARPVLTQGASTKTGLILLQRVTSTAAVPDRTLSETYWKLTELDHTAAPVAAGQREAHLILHGTDHRLTGHGGCNRLSGRYTVDGRTLSFGQVAATRMACLDGMDQETLFLKVLERTRSYAIEGDHLVLTDESHATLARFTAVDMR